MCESVFQSEVISIDFASNTWILMAADITFYWILNIEIWAIDTVSCKFKQKEIHKEMGGYWIVFENVWEF